VPDRRHLLGVLVYNGRGVVPRCLESAARLVSFNVDVAVFDDCSPSEGWSAEVEDLCGSLGISYYRTPRNLGIPRNMSLAMRTGVAGAYDVVGLVNSDVVLPANLVQATDAILDLESQIGSITPWSNNVSAFSLPMHGATPAIADLEFVSHLSTALWEANGTTVIDVPTGVGYCLMIPTAAIRAVGVMDPIFGRGYCEEVDWCQRARLAGYRNVLSLGNYVYHEGSGTNVDEGLLAHGMTTVTEHEMIVQGRYPDYMQRVAAFFRDRTFGRRGMDSLRAALQSMVGETGYDLVFGGISPHLYRASNVLSLSAQERRLGHLRINGLEVEVEAPIDPNALVTAFGKPLSVTVAEPGITGSIFAEWARLEGIPVSEYLGYPVGL
jgi:GT2 family glycosyltransferase